MTLSLSKSAKLLVGLTLLSLFRFWQVCGGHVLECHTPGHKLYLSTRGGHLMEGIRQDVSNRVRGSIPSPHSELVLGTTLGIDDLNRTPRFNDALISTGTIHVVVVSGYNMSLILTRFINLFKNKKSFTFLLIAQLGAVMYALITGFEPPVVRALVMSSIVLWARRYKKKQHSVRLLFGTLLLMLIIDPLYLFSLSFQLSAFATLGLIVVSNPIERYVSRHLGHNFFVSDFAASLSAQILVLPLLSYYFGRVNFVSALINGVVLWLIPPITVLGLAAILFMYIHPIIGTIISIPLLYLSDLFINIIVYAGGVFPAHSLVEFSLVILGIYYLVLFALILYGNRSGSRYYISKGSV